MDTLPPDLMSTGFPDRVPLSRVLASEVAVSIVVNILFNLFFAWLIFGGMTSMRRDAILLDVLPATFIPALLMTFPITFLMRARLRKGLIVTPDARLPIALPRKLVARGPAIALLALLVVGVPVVLLLWASWSGDWNWSKLIVFKLVFSVFHASIVTPFVVLAALSEAPDRGGASAKVTRSDEDRTVRRSA